MTPLRARYGTRRPDGRGHISIATDDYVAFTARYPLVAICFDNVAIATVARAHHSVHWTLLKLTDMPPMDLCAGGELTVWAIPPAKEAA